MAVELEAPFEIGASDEVGRFVEGRSVVVVDGLAELVVVDAENALSVVFRIQSGLENKSHIDFPHI